MKSSNSIKIEVDGVQSPTDQLRDNSSLNSSPIDTPSIAIGNYDHYDTSIPYKKSATKLSREIPMGHQHTSPLILGTASFVTEIPTGHVNNDTISIQKLLHLLPAEIPTGHGSKISNCWIDFSFLLMISPNLLHVLQLDLGSVVQPRLTSFGISTHTFTIDSNQSEFSSYYYFLLLLSYRYQTPKMLLQQV